MEFKYILKRVLHTLFIVMMCFLPFWGAHAQVSFLGFRVFNANNVQQALPNVILQHPWAEADTTDQFGSIQLVLLESQGGTKVMANIMQSDFVSFNSTELIQTSGFTDEATFPLYVWKANDWIVQSNRWFQLSDSIFQHYHTSFKHESAYFPVAFTLMMHRNFPYLQHRTLMSSYRSFAQGDVASALKNIDTGRLNILLEEWVMRSKEAQNEMDKQQAESEINMILIAMQWKIALHLLSGNLAEAQSLEKSTLQLIQNSNWHLTTRFLFSFFEKNVNLGTSLELSIPENTVVYPLQFVKQAIQISSGEKSDFGLNDELLLYTSNTDFQFEALDALRRFLEMKSDKKQLSETRDLISSALQLPVFKNASSELVNVYKLLLKRFEAQIYTENEEFTMAAEHISQQFSNRARACAEKTEFEHIAQMYANLLLHLPHHPYHNIDKFQLFITQNSLNNNWLSTKLKLAQWHYLHYHFKQAEDILAGMKTEYAATDTAFILQKAILETRLHDSDKHLNAISSLIQNSGNKYIPLALEADLIYLQRDMEQATDEMIQMRISELQQLLSHIDVSVDRLSFLLENIKNTYLLRTQPEQAIAAETSNFLMMWASTELSELQKWELMKWSIEFLGRSKKYIYSGNMANEMLNAMQEGNVQEEYLRNINRINILLHNTELWLSVGEHTLALQFATDAMKMLDTHKSNGELAQQYVQCHLYMCEIQLALNPAQIQRFAADLLVYPLLSQTQNHVWTKNFAYYFQAKAATQLNRNAEAWRHVMNITNPESDTLFWLKSLILKAELYVNDKKYDLALKQLNQDIFHTMKPKYARYQAEGQVKMLEIGTRSKLFTNWEKCEPFISAFKPYSASDTISSRLFLEMQLYYTILLFDYKKDASEIQQALQKLETALFDYEIAMPQAVHFYKYRYHLLYAQVLTRQVSQTTDPVVWDRAMEQFMQAELLLPAINNAQWAKTSKAYKDQLLKVARE